MTATYTMQTLQFGSNTLRVPGHEVDIIAQNQPAPLQKKVADSGSGVWDLIFSLEAGNFFLASATVPGIDKATIQSWYAKEGVPMPGPHTAGFIPFLIDKDGPDTGFAQASHFVDFSQPTLPANADWINTDTIAAPSVVATVHQILPEYAKMSIATHATSHSIIITTTNTSAVFDKIFVYGGTAIPAGNVLTVPKGQSVQALAIYKKTTTSSSKEIGTIQFPKIPWTEWPVLVEQIVNEIMANKQGELYEHLSPRVLAGLDPATAKTAVAAITSHIEQLGKVKNAIGGLVVKPGK